MRRQFFQARKFDGENTFRAVKTNFPVWSLQNINNASQHCTADKLEGTRGKSLPVNQGRFHPLIQQFSFALPLQLMIAMKKIDICHNNSRGDDHDLVTILVTEETLKICDHD